MGLTGQWFASDPAVSERRALPARSLDRHFMLTCMGSRRTRRSASLPTSVNNLSTAQFYGDGAIILTAYGNQPRFRYRQTQGCRRNARTLSSYASR